jgi:hypothetical protein
MLASVPVPVNFWFESKALGGEMRIGSAIQGDYATLRLPIGLLHKSTLPAPGRAPLDRDADRFGREYRPL